MAISGIDPLVIATVRDCGPDLEYDADFLALQQAALGKREQQFGDTIIPAELPDWGRTARLATELLGRTTDVRVLCLLAQAQAEQQGLPGFAHVVETLVERLEQQWEQIHPQLVQDGDDDPMPRMNALAALADTAGTVRSLRAAFLIEADHSRLSLRDVELLLDGSRSEQGGYRGGRERLVTELQRGLRAGQPAITAVREARAALRRLDACVVQHLGESWTPDLAALLRPLDLVDGVLQSPESAAAAAAAEALAAEVAAAPEAVAQSGQAVVAVAAPVVTIDWRDLTVSQREDAMLMLDKVCAYFETYEPSHPAPLLLRRVQQLMPMNFYDIVRNLAPQGADQVALFMPQQPEG